MERNETERLWQEYLFLSQEILKFVEQENMDMVDDLLGQRDRLQTMIDTEGDKAYPVGTAGQKTLGQIHQLNQGIVMRMRGSQQRMQAQHAMTRAYEASSIYRDSY